jgi:hypothetical protein
MTLLYDLIISKISIISYQIPHAIKMTTFAFIFKASFIPYLLTLPLFAGVSRVRALSSAWTGSHARETLISPTHLFLPHDIPPTKKLRTIKS